MAEQCKGLTKSGKQCRNKNGLVNGYCNLHVKQAPDNKIDDDEEKPKTVFEDENPVCDDFEECNNMGAKAIYVVAAIFVLIMMVKLLRKNGD